MLTFFGGIALQLLGGLRWVGGLFSALFKWALEHPAQAVCLLLMAILGWTLHFTVPGLKEDVTKWRGQYQAEVDAHNGTIFNIERGKRIAAEMDRRNLVRVKAEFNEKLLELSHENSQLRDRNRSLVTDRLRRPEQTASVDTGGGGAANLPVLSILPGGIVPDTGAAIISKSDALICADNHSQLIGIIAAWQAASTIDVNGVDPVPE